MIKTWIRAIILTAAFFVALAVSSWATNHRADDHIIDLGQPTLPRLSFQVAGKTANILAGYVNEMDITAMRDTITPINNDGSLTVMVERYGNEIEAVSYEVYSLDGTTCYDNGEVRINRDDSITLKLGDVLSEKKMAANDTEAVLKITLKTGTKNIYYFTRIERPEALSIAECLNFAMDFHNKTFDHQFAEELKAFLEPGEESDNTTFQTVNIHSDIEHVQWGKLFPNIQGDVEWSITECNSVYTSIFARYQVTCSGDEDNNGTYNVKEFFRVRSLENELYLLNYSRTMNQIFDTNQDIITEKGISLGLAPANLVYETNKDGTIVSFVLERELWTYNESEERLAQVFSFTDAKGNDIRSRYDQHTIRIISVDDSGSTTFAVYGYMNRGNHEGQVGVNIYYYDIEKNAVEEKAFIPNNKSFGIALDEFGKMVYYSHGDEVLYVLAGGTLYKVNLTNNSQTVLVENLEEGQYVAGDDGSLLAYQADGSLNSAVTVQVMNLKTGLANTLKAPEGEAIRPLGFIQGDFVMGGMKPDDAGNTVTGEAILPMYKLEIRSDNGKNVVKTYQADQIYISDILIANNQLTLNRLVKNGPVYTGIAQDYITNNEVRRDRGIGLESYISDIKGRQMRLTFADGIASHSPRILRPMQVTTGNPTTIAFDEKVKRDKFYVYAIGELAGVYDKAAYAIQRAEQLSGVVISSEQSYIWERGNRSLVYDTEFPPFQTAGGQTSRQACEDIMNQQGAKRVDLTGCTLSQVMYVINKGLPVIGMLDQNRGILITGYTVDTVTYIEPDSGTEITCSIDEMNAIMAGSGNAYIGYIK